MEARSKSQIVRATGIIGAASIVNMAAGLVRTKIAAVLLGASGVGLIGILISLMSTAAILGGWGISNTAAREIAAVKDDQETAVARKSWYWATIALGIVCAVAVFVLQRPLARWVFQDEAKSWMVAWIAFGAALTIVGSAQNGLLTGYKRVGDLARVSVISAVLATITGVPVLFAFRQRGIVAYVLLSTVITVVVGAYFIRRIPRPVGRPHFRELRRAWRTMASLGAALTIGSVVAMGGQLIMRVIVQRNLGLEGVGLFQASFTIAVNYLGLALAALGTDYYPRLVPHINDPYALRRLINDQSLVSLLIAAPMIVAVLGFAPVVVALLFAPSFVPAAAMLRWQLLGDLLKIVSWPLAFLLLASGRGIAFAANEAISTGIGIGVMALLVPRLGIAGAGLAYLAQQLAYAVSVNWLVHRQTQGTWEPATVRSWTVVVAAAVVTLLASALRPFAGLLIAAIASAILAVWTLRHLHESLPDMIASRLPRLVLGKSNGRAEL